jgi:hypothetical protein
MLVVLMMRACSARLQRSRPISSAVHANRSGKWTSVCWSSWRSSLPSWRRQSVLQSWDGNGGTGNLAHLCTTATNGVPRLFAGNEAQPCFLIRQEAPPWMSLSLLRCWFVGRSSSPIGALARCSLPAFAAAGAAPQRPATVPLLPCRGLGCGRLANSGRYGLRRPSWSGSQNYDPGATSPMPVEDQSVKQVYSSQLREAGISRQIMSASDRESLQTSPLARAGP